MTNKKNGAPHYFILQAGSIAFAVLLVTASLVFSSRTPTGQSAREDNRYRQPVKEMPSQLGETASVENWDVAVFPAEGTELPVAWKDLGLKMVSAGVIDMAQFESLYKSRGGTSEEMKRLLYGDSNGNLRITSENSGMILNLLWALGLGNRNEVLLSGPMQDPRYGGVDRFASTGGWTLARGDAMAHYSRHPFIVLTQEQQELVERVAKNIYRPCCNNPTHLPDCNHGMAMLGLLELMASQSVGEADMYKVALQVNAYWFPNEYRAVAEYFAKRGSAWERVDPREVLGVDYSSASGYRRVLAEIKPQKPGGGGSCGV